MAQSPLDQELIYLFFVLILYIFEKKTIFSSLTVCFFLYWRGTFRKLSSTFFFSYSACLSRFFIPLHSICSVWFLKVDPTPCRSIQSVHACTKYTRLHQLVLFSPFYFLNECTDSKLQPSTEYFWSFFFHFYLFFVCQTWRICEPVVWRHLISCLLLCWATKKTTFITNKLFIVFIVFLRDVLLKYPACWTCMVYFFFFLFFFSAWRLFVGWLQHGIHSSFFFRPPHFFGTETKKWQDISQPPSHPPCNPYMCISAVLKCTTSGCH